MKNTSAIATVKLQLPASNRKDWLAAIRQLVYPEMGPWEAFFETATAAAQAFLTADIKQAMQELSSYFINAVFIEGLPMDSELPPTPTGGYRPSGKSGVSEAVLLGLVGQAAQPFGYLQEKSGRLIHEVAPVIGKEMERSNAGRENFAAHIDNSFLAYPFRPQLLALIGLVNEQRIPTFIYGVDDQLAKLSAAYIDGLHRSDFRLRCPDSFGFRTPIWVDQRPLLEQIGGVTIAGCNNGYNVEPMSERAASSYAALCDTIDRAEPQEICVLPGSALIFANCRVWHARPKIEGGDRWLQRVYGTFDLAGLQAAANANSRIFDSRQFF